MTATRPPTHTDNHPARVLSSARRRPVTVLLVDDQAVIRRGLRAFLDGYDDIAVIGEADTGPEGVAKACALRPDVVVMDVRMPGGDGIAATERIRTDCRSRVLILTTFEVDDYLFAALDAGAAGFMLKDSNPDDLADAVRTAARGGCWLPPPLAARVVQEFARRSRPPDAAREDDAIEDLTNRELEVASLVADGLSNRQIAQQLTLEVTTVKAHVASIFGKLGVCNRVMIAIRLHGRPRSAPTGRMSPPMPPPVTVAPAMGVEAG